MTRRIILLAVLFLLLILPASAEIVFSEVMASNGTYINGEAYDWIELHNTGSQAVNLSGCYLSDSKKNLTKWAFPAGTTIKAGGYIIVYCTGEEMNPGKNEIFYANFKISASGEKVFLTAKDGETAMASLSIPSQYGTVSWGLPEGGTEYLYFAEATPGTKNPKVGYAGRAMTPVIQTEGGFFDEPVTVTAQSPRA